MCYGTSGTPLDESAAARECRAHRTTESRRHLVGLFTGSEQNTAWQPQSIPDTTHTQGERKSAAKPAEEQHATPVAKTHGNMHTETTPTGQEAQEVASIVQAAGLAAILVVEDILVALERNPSEVSYVVRAIAWSKLSEEAQSEAMDAARKYRGR